MISGGWACAALILLAYSCFRWGGDGIRRSSGDYVVGAAGFVLNAWGTGDALAASVVWALIGAFALWRLVARRGNAGPNLPDE